MKGLIVVLYVVAFIVSAPYLFAPEKHEDPIGNLIKKAIK